MVHMSAAYRISGPTQQASRHLLLILDWIYFKGTLTMLFGGLFILSFSLPPSLSLSLFLSLSLPTLVSSLSPPLSLHSLSQLLGSSNFVQKDFNRGYVLSTEGEFTGGFSKWPFHNPGDLIQCGQLPQSALPLHLPSFQTRCTPT